MVSEFVAGAMIAVAPRPEPQDREGNRTDPGARVEEERGGKSGLHRARWWVTPTARSLAGPGRDSATENKPPRSGCLGIAVGVRVKR